MTLSRVIQKQLAKGIESEVFPGACAVVGGLEDPPVIECIGVTRFGAGSENIVADSWFDLASLTKVISTTSIVARLFQDRKLRLDEDLHREFMDLSWAVGWGPVLLRLTLAHQAGFPAWHDFADERRQLTHQPRKGTNELKGWMLERIASLPPAYSPGEKTVYSDLGFILVGEFLSRMTSESLESLFESEVRKPLKLESTSPNPTVHVGLRKIAATEELSNRGGVIQGVVHDDNAFILGGLAGHAGLFGTAKDCFQFGLEWLRALEGKSNWLRQDTAELFVDPVETTSGEARPLGWDIPTPPSSGGRRISKNAIGHLGYTGTSIWIDLERRTVVVLLTNRVHPTSKNEKIKSFRPAFHDAIWEALDA